MRITIIALGSRGDVQPYAVLGKGLVAVGHSVSFVTTENFTPLLNSYGLRSEPLPGDAERVVKDAGANMAALSRAFNRIAAGIIDHAERIIPTIAEADLILNQLPLGAYGLDIAEKFGVPMWLVATIPLVPTSAFPMMGWPAAFARIPGYNRLSYRISELMGWLLLRPYLQRWRKDVLGLPKLSSQRYLQQLHQIPVLHGFSKHVVPPPPDWPPNVYTTSNWFEPQPNWQPPDELMRFIDGGSPPVYIGFGSMPIPSPQDTTQIILRALEQAGQRAILHAGWGSLGMTSLPDSVHPIEYAPYDWLFPRMSALVHHGGSGTTAAGLSSGIPALVVPILFDQYFWGQRIAELGTGPHPIPFKKLTAQSLADAIRTMTIENDMRVRAAGLGEKLRREDGLQAAVKMISQPHAP